MFLACHVYLYASRRWILHQTKHSNMKSSKYDFSIVSLGCLLYGIYKAWLLMCIIRWYFEINPLPQKTQWYGFSITWLFPCLFKSSLRKILCHTEHSDMYTYHYESSCVLLDDICLACFSWLFYTIFKQTRCSQGCSINSFVID